jgi:flagellar motor switch/type III secretory pathway protein FliN
MTMNPTSMRGRLSFSVGETLLSAWEAARLAPGDIVLTGRQAGYPGFVLFNNLPLGLGEVVVFDHSFGVRLVDTDFRPGFQVDPGRIDTLGEVVPGWVDLGGFDVDFGDLAGLGPNSFLNLGVPPASKGNAVLWWGGVPLARGTVVVVGELMGLRVTERLVDLATPATVRQSGNLADRNGASMAKDYDFARPDRWSHQQIKRLEDVHRLFQRHLEASLPGAAGLLGRTEALVDQCTLGEALATLATGGLALRQTWEHEAPRRRSRSEAPRPQTLFLEAAGGPLPLDAGTRRYLEALVGAPGPGHRPVYLHAGAWLADDELPVLTGCLRNGWKRLLDFRLDPTTAPEPALADHEMVILVLFRPGQGSAPVMALVYPFLTIEPYANVLGS